MAKVKFELNRQGVSQLLKGTEMQNVLRNHAQQTAAACGHGYKTDIHVGTNRANAGVYADSESAKRDNLKNNTILKNLQ